MQVREIMTEDPACCSPESTLQEAAKLMVDCDCGEIPVLDDQNRPIGVITDRDICCRAVAQGLEGTQTRVQEVMSSPVVTVHPEDSVDLCCQLMDDNQIRRIPVVDDSGTCRGIVAQADIARTVRGNEIGDMLRDISKPGQGARPH
ncbi:CBS domain-containing protein [Gilvimarinus sp. F26214L]|uniref:CBS domain-containing protein n=1 Tax=Gilvimarinus sp. DZF01 TaxID=3461371 RepID=UPI0040454D6F